MGNRPSPPRVLVLRAGGPAEETARALREAGAEAFVVPLETPRPLPFSVPARSPDLLLATSANAFLDAETLPESWRDRPLLVVGDRTRRAAERAGFGAIAAVGRDVRDLIERLPTHLPAGAHAVYLAGRPRRPELEAALAGDGRSCVTIERYRMARPARLPEPLRLALADRSVATALHFSAGSARHLVRLAGREGCLTALLDMRHAALSPRIADALATALPGARIVTASAPNAAALLRVALAESATQDVPGN